MTDDLQRARVEAAAEGMWNLYGDRGMFTHAPEHLRNGFMKDARAALAAADAHLPSVEQIAEVIAAVIEAHKDSIGTHYPECWKYHAGCLAVLLRDMGAADEAE